MFAVRISRLAILTLAISVFVTPFDIPATAVTTDCTISDGTKCILTFSYTGAPETFTVPAGVTSIYFDVQGAQGGASTSSQAGGKGGIDTGTLTVSPGANLIIYVGGQGTSALAATSGGFNGGGGTNSNTSAPGTGGGASDIRLNVDTLTARVVVAGGGGGGDNYNSPGTGGAGGGLTGGNGVGAYCGGVGRGGTQVAGGAMNTGTCAFRNDTSGSFGIGGRGQGYSTGGGGGGGGWYGGSGGYIAGGGGGSSRVDTSVVSNYSLVQGGRSGHGIVTLTYSVPQQASAILTGVTGAIFNVSKTLTFSSNSPGKVTFLANGKVIAGCRNVSTASGSSPYLYTCSWKPALHGSNILSATITPNNGNFPGSTQVSAGVDRRTTKR